MAEMSFQAGGQFPVASGGGTGSPVSLSIGQLSRWTSPVLNYLASGSVIIDRAPFDLHFVNNEQYAILQAHEEQLANPALILADWLDERGHEAAAKDLRGYFGSK